MRPAPTSATTGNSSPLLTCSVITLMLWWAGSNTPDEAPLPLIVAGLAEVANRTHTPPKTLWKHLTAWAQAPQSLRVV